MIDLATCDADTVVGALRPGDRVRLWSKGLHAFTIGKVHRLVQRSPEGFTWAGVALDGIDEVTGETRTVWFASNALVRAECPR